MNAVAKGDDASRDIRTRECAEGVIRYAAIPRKTCDNCHGKGESGSALGPIECNWCQGTGLRAVDFGKLAAGWKALHDEIHALRAALKRHNESSSPTAADGNGEAERKH